MLRLAAMLIVSIPAAAQDLPGVGAEAGLPPARPIPRPTVSPDRVGHPGIRANAVADLPEAALVVGAHGEVVVTGTVGTDGRMRDAAVTQSSRSPSLDDTALAAARATRFFPARMADGSDVAAPFSMTFAFGAYRRGRTTGLRTYRCAVFLRDVEWWRATWGTTKENPVHVIMQYGQLAERIITQSVRWAAVPSPQMTQAFEQRWGQTIAACRTQPDALFRDVFQGTLPAEGGK